MALRQCKKCSLDISDIVRIKCAECEDMELCVECFAEGTELNGHKKDHAYSVVQERPDFPIFDANWSAEEELLLLEGIDSHGMGNWADISEYIGSKTLEETRDHYIQCYLDSPTSPLPVSDKTFTKEEIDSLRDRRRHYRENWKPSSNIPKPIKPLTSVPANHEVAGFMPMREEFDTEFENDAEYVISGLAFLEDDPPEERELKHKLLEIYTWKLKRRYARRALILNYGLINYRQHQAADKKRTKEEKELHVAHRPFAKFLTPKEFDLFVEGINAENEIRTRIGHLQEFRRLGMTTLAAIEHAEGDRRKREAEQNKKKNKELNYGALKRGREETAKRPGNLLGSEGVQLLSPREYDLCMKIHIMPRAYVHIKEAMIQHCNQHGYLKRSEVKSMLQGDTHRTEKIFDFLVSAGWLNPTELTQPALSSSSAAATAATAQVPEGQGEAEATLEDQRVKMEVE